jgi:hypothetical protein
MGMGDDTAVRWSDYESFRSQVEYDTRHKIAAGLEKFIENSRVNGLSNHFVSGIELAKGYALGLVDEPPSTSRELDYPTLF